MTHEKIITPPPEPKTESAPAGNDQPADGPIPLLQQAAEFAEVARQALDDCQRGAEAEQELIRRRNRPGQ